MRSTTLSSTAEMNVDQNIQKARRTTYALMSTGLHGNSGLDIPTKLHLIQLHVIPVLLYGLEIILPNKTLL